MNDSFDIRAYQPGDETAILDLFEQSFDIPMSIEFWNWRFRDNPEAEPMIDLAWDGDVLAAHYAVSPIIISLAGTPHLAALSMTTMTHPDYRGKGLFTTLASTLYARMEAQGYVIVWGFPNHRSHYGLIRHLMWQDICEIPMFRLDINELRFTPSISDKIIQLSTFGKQFDALWGLAGSNYDIAVRRDHNYLNWRFIANPQHTYYCYGYIEGGQLLGYIVFKQYKTVEIDIVDFLTVPEWPVVRELVGAVLEYCRQNSYKAINTWLPLRYPFHLDLEKTGFRNHEPITYFGSRILNSAVANLDFGDVRQWYYTMGDSDTF